MFKLGSVIKRKLDDTLWVVIAPDSEKPNEFLLESIDDISDKWGLENCVFKSMDDYSSIQHLEDYEIVLSKKTSMTEINSNWYFLDVETIKNFVEKEYKKNSTFEEIQRFYKNFRLLLSI